MLTPAQCRAARGLLKWTQQDLADRSEIGLSTIKKLELEVTTPHKSTLKILRQTFEAHGVAFLDENGGGLKLRG
ncbi:MAG: helix-turn-helix domain-containing protein [Sphingomonadales bacterium]|nr:helix-turn-helix domain-containing protein [Sphingomonadales bacterium]